MGTKRSMRVTEEERALLLAWRRHEGVPRNVDQWARPKAGHERRLLRTGRTLGARWPYLADLLEERVREDGEALVAPLEALAMLDEPERHHLLDGLHLAAWRFVAHYKQGHDRGWMHGRLDASDPPF